MPVEPWAFITVCSFWGWVAAIIRLSLSFRAAASPFDTPVAARCWTAFVILFLLWVLAMRLA